MLDWWHQYLYPSSLLPPNSVTCTISKRSMSVPFSCTLGRFPILHVALLENVLWFLLKKHIRLVSDIKLVLSRDRNWVTIGLSRLYSCSPCPHQIQKLVLLFFHRETVSFVKDFITEAAPFKCVYIFIEHPNKK